MREISIITMKTVIFLCIVSCVFFSSVSAKPKKFALLVATTKSWLFYRHQATVLHAYHTLIANGFSKENIITMTYDDLANNPRNPEKGVVRNHPLGDNLYPTAKRDYTGNKVNADTFMAVLNGDEGSAKGPVIKGGPKDTLFVYVVGFGITQYFTFPTGPGLPALKFVGALKKLISEKKMKKIYVHLETSFAASMVAGLLPRKGNIFVVAATHYHEIPGATYCNSKTRICYGSLFGCAWTQRSDRLRQMKFGKKATLWDMFNYGRTLTSLSHVNMFGHLEMARGKLAEFLDYKLVPRKSNDAYDSSLLYKLAEAMAKNTSAQEQLDNNLDFMFEWADDENINDVASSMLSSSMNELEAAVMLSSPSDDGATKKTILKNRNLVSKMMDEIFQQIKTNNLFQDVDEFKRNAYMLPPLGDEALEVYEKTILAFNEECFNMNEHPHVQSEMSKFVALAAAGVPFADQNNAIKSVCSKYLPAAKSII